MNKNIINRFNLIITINIVVIVIMFKLIDFTLGTVLNDFDTISLQDKSKHEILTLQNKIADNNIKCKLLQKKTEVLKKRHYPSLQEFKQSVKNYSIDISKVQKVKNLENSLIEYSISLQGSIYNLLKLMNQIESDFIVNVNSVYLYPADTDGNNLTLEMLLLINN